MLSTKSGVVFLHLIVIYLYENLHVLGSTCNIYTDIEEYIMCLFDLRMRLDILVNDRSMNLRSDLTN